MQLRCSQAFVQYDNAGTPPPPCPLQEEFLFRHFLKKGVPTMKHTLHVAVAFVFALLLHESAAAQWISTTGIPGGQINSFEVILSTTFAGTWGGGVYSSADQGGHWTYSGLIGQKVRSLAAQGTYLFAGTHTGVWLSKDNGGTWASVNDVNQINQYVYAMAASGIYMIAAGYGGITRTSDNGATWELGNQGLTSPSDPVPDVRALAGPSGDLFCGIPGFGVSLSVDNGKTWNPTATQPPDLSIQALAYTGGTVWAGTQTGVFVSTNFGTTWSNFSAGGPTNFNVLSLTFQEPNIIAGTSGGGAFVSPTASANWSAINTGLSDPTVLALIVNGKLFAGTNGGVFSSVTPTTSSSTWSVANTGLTATRVYAMAVNGTTLFAGAYGSGLFRSTDDGTTWTPTGVANHYVHSILVNGSSIYAGSEGGFYHSTDNGLTWSIAVSGLGLLDGRDVRSILVHGTTLYAGTLGAGVFVSTDGGANWTAAANTGLTNTDVWGLAYVGTTLYAGTQGTGVFASTDGGATWTLKSNGITGSEALFINTMTSSGNTLFAGTGTVLWESTNGGANWYDSTGDLGTNYILSVVPSGTNFFVGIRNGGGVFYSKVFGPSYTNVGDAAGLTSTWVSSMAINNSELYLGISGAGVWRRPLTQMGYEVHAAAKVYLQGPYVASGDSMAHNLLTGGQLAAHFGAIPIPRQAVDSINVELRNDSTSGTASIRKFAPAWLLSNGTIRNFVDTTKAYVDFDSLLPGKYYTVIHHRNHLAIMGAVRDSIDANASPAGRDFSTGQAQAYGFSPLVPVGTKFAMYAGDVNGDGTLQYSGAGNDRALILVRIGGSDITATVSGYYNEDINLDSVVKYSGALNDRSIILVNIGGSDITATVSSRVH